MCSGKKGVSNRNPFPRWNWEMDVKNASRAMSSSQKQKLSKKPFTNKGMTIINTAVLKMVNSQCSIKSQIIFLEK